MQAYAYLHCAQRGGRSCEIDRSRKIFPKRQGHQIWHGNIRLPINDYTITMAISRTLLELRRCKGQNRLSDKLLPHLMPSLGLIPCEFLCRQKLRVHWLVAGEDDVIIYLFVLTQYWRVSEGRTDRNSTGNTALNTAK